MRIRPSESVWDELNELLSDSKKVLLENDLHIVALFIVGIGLISIISICILNICF
ncbi:hypothetical protein ACM55G_04775 [Flavobacterium sp. LB3P122]